MKMSARIPTALHWRTQSGSSPVNTLLDAEVEWPDTDLNLSFDGIESVGW